MSDAAAVPVQSPPVNAPATRVRHGVIWFSVFLAVITYVDRVCISKAAPLIQKDLGLTEKQMGAVLGIFFLTYGIFEVPWGWLGDKIGARKVLMRIVVCWSFFTAATGWTWNLGSLLVTRALFGIGEAGCFPNVTKAFTTWLPSGERVRAQGFLWLSARWSGAFTPLLVMVMLTALSWRTTFMIFGALGVVWAFFFYRWYRDDPADHPGINAAERDLLPRNAGAAGHAPVPWGRVLRSPRVWLLFTQYACLAYAAGFYVTWLSTYLERSYPHLSPLRLSLYNAFPLFFAGIGSLFCGLFLSKLTTWLKDSGRARKGMAALGFLGSAIATLAFIWIESPLWKMVALGVAGFMNDLVMPPSWAACMDLGRKFSGTLSGSMNMMGCAGGALFPFIVPHIREWTGGSWNAVFYVSAAVYFVGMFCWFFIDPVTPIDAKEEAA